MLGATISTNFPWEVYLGKLCMMHVRAQRRTMQATSHTSLRARPCARRRSWDGAACVGQGSILADPTTYQRYRYPSTVSELLSSSTPPRESYPDFDIFTHISQVSRSVWFSWQDSRSFYRLEICFALDCRWHATTVTFYREIFLRKAFYCCRSRICE